MDLLGLDETLLSGWPRAILLGMWFGTLHAFDADHLATVGGIAVGGRQSTPVGYALRWAAGHALALGAIAAAVALGLAGAVALALPAEVLVAAALVAIGAHLIHGAARPRPRVRRARSARASIGLGLLHGCAGSAAVLALLPLAQLASGAVRALYLLSFSLGVAAGAVVFATLFTAFAARAAAAAPSVGVWLHATIGTFAVVSGSLLIAGLALGTGHGGG